MVPLSEAGGVGIRAFRQLHRRLRPRRIIPSRHFIREYVVADGARTGGRGEDRRAVGGIGTGLEMLGRAVATGLESRQQVGVTASCLIEECYQTGFR